MRAAAAGIIYAGGSRMVAGICIGTRKCGAAGQSLLGQGSVLLLQSFLHVQRLYRAQSGIMLISVLAPWVGNVLHISDLYPFSYLDLTPFAFTLTGLAVAWGLFRFRLLDVVPVARDVVIEGMYDGVIVLDAQGRVVDINPAARQLINRSDADLVGRPAVQLLSDWPDGSTELAEILVERYGDVAEVRTQITLSKGRPSAILTSTSHRCTTGGEISPVG